MTNLTKQKIEEFRERSGRNGFALIGSLFIDPNRGIEYLDNLEAWLQSTLEEVEREAVKDFMDQVRQDDWNTCDCECHNAELKEQTE